MKFYSIHSSGFVWNGKSSCKVNKTPDTVCVWAWFTSSGEGKIRRIYNEEKTDEYFVNLLDECLVPTVYKKFGVYLVIFLHERTPYVFPSSFSCGPMRDFLTDNKNISSRAWPPKSRDLNRSQLYGKNLNLEFWLLQFQPNNAEDLFEKIENLWDYRRRRLGYWKELMDQMNVNLKADKDLKWYRLK